MRNSGDNVPLWFIGVCLGVIVLVCLGLTILMFGLYKVDAGERGIVMRQGRVAMVEEEGLVAVLPWHTVVKISTKLQVEEESGPVPTSQGIQCTLDTALIFRVNPDKAKVESLYKSVGIEYQKNLVERTFQSSIRLITTKHTAEDLYSGSRDSIEGEILAECRNLLEPYGIICEQVLMKSVTLPPVLANRTTEKQAAEQDVQRMQFVLKQKELEAQARVVEAKGIADAQLIIKKDLDDNYLRYLWIEALKHHTGATIYIPTGGDGMPFFKQVK